MGSVYLTRQRFYILAYAIPPVRLDECESQYPGFIEGQIEVVSAEIEDRLRHKYIIPFPVNHMTIQGWIAAIVQLRVISRIGIDPSDSLYQEVQRRAEEVDKQITDAGDPKTSRWNFPLVASGNSSAVSKGAPFGYSEASPYSWLDEQALAVVDS